MTLPLSLTRLPRLVAGSPQREYVALDDVRALGNSTGWRDIATAPYEVPVFVYTPPQPEDWPDSIRIEIDCRAGEEEDGYWINHSEAHEHYMAVGGSGAAGPDTTCAGPSEKAPYTHWMPIPAVPGAHPAEQQEGDAAGEKDAALLQAMAAEWDRARRGVVSRMPIWDALCDAVGENADGAGMRAAISAAMQAMKGDL